METEKPLQNIGISNDADEETFLVADSPCSQIFGVLFMLPVAIFVVFSLIALFLPNKENIQTTDFPFTKQGGVQTYKVNNTISNISAVYQYLSMNFSLLDPPSDSSASGSVNLTIYNNANVVNRIFFPFMLKDAKEPIQILNKSLIGFNRIESLIAFTTDAKADQKYRIYTISMDSAFSLTNILCRIVFSMLIAPYLLSDLIGLLDVNSRVTTLEQQITISLSIFTILYLDPFYALQIYVPNTYNIIIKIILRDIFYAYIAFYAISLYSYFGHVSNSHFVRLSFPFALMLISILLFLWFDVQKYISAFAQNSSISNIDVREDLGALHYLYLIIYTVVFIIRALVSRNYMTQGQAQRWIYYSAANLVVLCILCIFAAVRMVAPDLLEGTFINEILPMALFTAYAMFMEFCHEDTDSINTDGYETPGIDVNDAELGIGVDEDLDQFSKKKGDQI